MCFNRSFASSDKISNWNYELNEVLPRNVFKSCALKCWFKCNICNHNYIIKLNDVSSSNRACPYCAHQKLCENKCDFCFQNSFASHPRSQHWSLKNELKPRQVFKSSNKLFIFNCIDCKNEFKTLLTSIQIMKVWCNICTNKTEKIFYNELIKIYPNIKNQYRVEWCKNQKYLPFDFVLEKQKIIIEVDGGQHFKQVWNWKSPEVQQENDKFKMKCANDNNFSIIRILQEDIYHDKYNWLEEIQENINKIIKEKKTQNIYMCKKNEYNIY